MHRAVNTGKSVRKPRISSGIYVFINVNLGMTRRFKMQEAFQSLCEIRSIAGCFARRLLQLEKRTVK